MTRILSIGECMIEMSPRGALGNYAMGFAGDTMNTAWYLRRLLPQSDQVGYFTAVGMDAGSEQMMGFLEGAGLETGQIARKADRTVGLYVIQLENGERSFNYWRGQSAARTLADDAGALDRALSGNDIAYFSGITLAILPKAAQATLLEAFRKFRAAGGQVVFDPNLRPALWANAQEMTETIMQAAAVSDTVLPSHEDEATWFGDASPEATAKRYGDQGAGVVIVKNGSGQMLALEDGTYSTHTPLAVSQVVDTTAAGDSFNAGFLAARVSGAPVGTAVMAGAGLAAKVVQAHGALVEVEGLS